MICFSLPYKCCVLAGLSRSASDAGCRGHQRDVHAFVGRVSSRPDRERDGHRQSDGADTADVCRDERDGHHLGSSHTGWHGSTQGTL